MPFRCLDLIPTFCIVAFDRFELSLEEWAIVRAIYGLRIKMRSFKSIIAKKSLFITYLLMTTKGIASNIFFPFNDSKIFWSANALDLLVEQYVQKEYVNPDMFFLSH